MRMRMSMIDVGMRLARGDAIDPFHLANGFEAVIGPGYECQDRSNHPFSQAHSYDAYKSISPSL